MDKEKLMLEYLDSSYRDVKLKYNQFSTFVSYDNHPGDWYAEKLSLSRTLSKLFSCTSNEAYNAIMKWERKKLFKK